jgi:prostaglandin-endoperoxide synthase 2
MTRVADGGAQAFGQADLAIHALEQQGAKIGGQAAALEIGTDRTTGNRCKSKLFWRRIHLGQSPVGGYECVFRQLPFYQPLTVIFALLYAKFRLDRRRKAYATGLERGNSTIGYAAISTLFMREHNRICEELAKRNQGWDDERLFQTARMINIVLLMKVVVEDYINHIAGKHIFKLDPTFAEDQNWYRTNWIAIEFNLLYRWHALVPDEIKVGDQIVSAMDFRNNNALLEKVGVGGVLTHASSQRAGRIGLFNAPSFLA